MITQESTTGLQSPSLSFEVEAPSKTDLTRFDAWIAGSDGSRLDLDVQTIGPNTHILLRQGYAHAPPDPRLVVRHQGEIVIDKPVAPLVAPIRAVPLVVPIDFNLELRRTEGLKLRFPLGAPERFWYQVAGGGAELDRVGDARLVRSEWIPGGGGFVRSPRRKGQPLILFSSKLAKPAAFGEIELSTVRKERFVREADVEIEIHHRDGAPKVRVLQAISIEFPDHASVTIPIQESRIESRRTDLPGNIRLQGENAKGLTALFLSKVQTSSPNAELGLFQGNPSAPPPDLPFQCELVSPKLEALGAGRLDLGSMRVAKVEKSSPAPLALGRHRLRIRVTHRAEIPLLRRIVVPFPP